MQEHWYSIFQETRFGYLLESPHWCDSNKYPKHTLYEEITIKHGICCISFCSLRILCNSKFILMAIITKICLYNFDPLKPHFYIVKLGFTGVYVIFLFLLKNIDCGYSLEPPRRGCSNEYLQFMLWAEIWKILEFFIWKFSDFGSEIFYIFE